MKTRHFLLVTSTWLAVASQVLGQANALSNLPAAPANGILDDTRALNEDTRQKLSAEISDCRQSTDIEVWLSASTFLPPGQNIRQYAKELRQRWSLHHPAVLLAYDRASETHMVSLSPTLWQQLPTLQVFTLLQNTAREMNQKDKPLDYRLAASLRGLVTQLHHYHRQSQLSQQPLSKPHLRLGQFYFVVLTGGATLLALLATRVRRRDITAAQQLFFPQLQVACRFGAPHGGGSTVENSPLS